MESSHRWRPGTDLHLHAPQATERSPSGPPGLRNILQEKQKYYYAHHCLHTKSCLGVYSGTPLMWTPWGPGKVSYTENVSKFTLRKHILGHSKVSFQYRGVLISRGVPLYRL